MIEPLLPRYYKAVGDNPRYEILDSYVINGHEVAWTEFSGVIIADITGQGREGEPYVSRSLVCECDFTEGVGWRVEDGKHYSLGGEKKCVFRSAVMYMRYRELREIYLERFANDNPSSEGSFLLKQNIRAIILDLIERSKAGELLEDHGGATFWGGYFYLQTVAAITDNFVGHLWEDVWAMMADELIGLEGAVIQPYREPPPPMWEEFIRIEEDDGWVGIAYLPGHRQMAREWKLEVKTPEGDDAYAFLPGLSLTHDPIFGPDVDDVARAEVRLMELIAESKDRRNSLDDTGR